MYLKGGGDWFPTPISDPIQKWGRNSRRVRSRFLLLFWTVFSTAFSCNLDKCLSSVGGQVMPRIKEGAAIHKRAVLFNKEWMHSYYIFVTCAPLTFFYKFTFWSEALLFLLPLPPRFTHPVAAGFSASCSLQFWFLFEESSLWRGNSRPQRMAHFSRILLGWRPRNGPLTVLNLHFYSIECGYFREKV